MQGPKAEGGDDVVSDINITPLCDILVVLLIIFMVTAQSAVLQGPQVTSPSENENSPPPSQKKESVSITIGADNSIYCDFQKDPVPQADLVERLRQELPKTTKQQVMIRSAPSLTLDDVMRVMEAAEIAGAKGIGVGTKTR